MTLMLLVPAIAGIFSICILAHEFGHYLMAKHYGVLISEFCIGFPGTPVICTLCHHGETAFTVRLVPLGGFVRQDAGTDVFSTLSPGQKVRILFGGSLFNLVLGIALMVPAIMLFKGMGFFAAVEAVCGYLSLVVTGTFGLLFKMELNTLIGPVGLAGIAGKAASAGFLQAVGFTGALSIAIGAMNLLPVPGLDGWHLLTTGIETLIGKPLNKQVQAIASLMGMMLFVALMCFVTYQDVVRILSR